MADILGGLASSVGSVFGATSSTTAQQFASGIAQNVAAGALGSAVLVSLQHPDVIAKLDPLGLTNIIHPVTGGAVAGAPTPTPAAINATTGLNPVAKTMTVTWYQANPTVAPLYIGQGWQIVAG